MDGVFSDSAAASTLASYLKRERELRQISIAELSRTTRIRLRILAPAGAAPSSRTVARPNRVAVSASP
jgi:hypothetical protein